MTVSRLHDRQQPSAVTLTVTRHACSTPVGCLCRGLLRDWAKPDTIKKAGAESGSRHRPKIDSALRGVYHGPAVSAREQSVLHHYPFHVADYMSHTRHLTPMEDLAYRRLIDLYYLHGKPPVGEAEDVARAIGLNECSTDVERVLNEFFREREIEGRKAWISKRCEAELARFQATREQRAKAGKASAASRKNTRSTGPLNKRSTNQNQEPRTSSTSPNGDVARARGGGTGLKLAKKPDDVKDETWAEFKVNRAAKKKPLTEKAWARIANKIKKAGRSAEDALCEANDRGWADWDPSWGSRSTGNPRGPEKITVPNIIPEGYYDETEEIDENGWPIRRRGENR